MEKFNNNNNNEEVKMEAMMAGEKYAKHAQVAWERGNKDDMLICLQRAAYYLTQAGHDAAVVGNIVSDEFADAEQDAIYEAFKFQR